MYCAREREGWNVLGQRNDKALTLKITPSPDSATRRRRGAALVLTGVLLAILPCCDRRSDPQAVFEHAHQTFVHGDLTHCRQEAERGSRQFLHSDPELAWKFRLLEADALMWSGESQEVLNLLNEQPTPLPDARFTIPKLILEGVAYAHLHQFPEAQLALERAEQLCAASTEASCATVKRARGVMAIEHGQVAEAQQFFEQTLTLARSQSDHFLEATALLNLGASSLRENHFDQAVDFSEAAYRLARALDAGEIAQSALGNLGWAYYELGDSEKALELFLEANRGATELGDVINHLRWLTTAGYIYLDRRDYSTAEQSYKQALDLAQQISSKEDIVNALMSLALVSEQMGKLEEANQYADRTIGMAHADGNRLDELYPLLVKGQVAARLHDSAQAERVFSEVAHDPKSDVSLKWEAEHELARLYEQENQADSANREYRAALNTFETARSSLQHEESELPFLTNASRIYDDYVHFLVARGRPEQALRVADFTRARTLAEGLKLLRKGTSPVPDALNPQAVARRAGGTILFYWLGEKQSYLWAITAQKTILFPLPPASEIDAAMQRYQRALAGPQDVLETSNANGIGLYQMLVAPAQAVLAKNAKVLIAPDGSLNRLNFETLLVQGPRLHYWIEDATISNASSLRLLRASGTPGNKGAGKLLLMGNPLAADRDYGELPNAALEMENIEKHFAPDDQTVYAREGATASAYLGSRPERFSYIHFVAHGTATRMSPLDSAVILSPSSGQSDSFKLYARDVIRCPLHAHLVTISTCYGAGTRAYSGEGLVGLSWAFLRAGAHNVIGALWEVNDTSTPQLMDHFYAELRKGKSPDAALRSAKLSLLGSNSAFHKPFYWASFQLYTGS
jgi:CHAT domain-containing protein